MSCVAKAGLILSEQITPRPEPEIISRNTALKDLPAFVAKYPGMLSPEDRLAYYTAARDFLFEGTIVDLGVFLGATTATLAYGILANPRIELGKVPKINVFDLFEANNSMWPWLDWKYGMGTTAPGDDLLPLFSSNLSHLMGMLHVNKTNILNVSWPIRRPIGLLGIDLCKNWAITNHVVRRFFPALRPGSVVLHQDYIHPWLPHIHVAMGYFADRFEIMSEPEIDSTVTFRMTKQIAMEEMSDFSDVLLNQPDKWMSLFDAAVERLTSQSRQTLFPARLVLIGEAEGREHAIQHGNSNLDKFRPGNEENFDAVMSFLGSS